MSIIKNFDEFKKYTEKGIKKIWWEYKILNTKVNNREGFSTFIDGKDKNWNIFKKKKGIILNQFTILYQNDSNDTDNLLYKELFINEIKKKRKVNNKKNNKKNMKNVSKDYFTEIVFRKIDLTWEIIDIDSIINDYKIKINEILKKIKVFNVNNIVIPLDNNIVVYDLERAKENKQYYEMVLKVRWFIINLIKFICNKNKDTKINVIILNNDNSDNMFLPIWDVLDIYFQDNNIIIDNKKEEQNKKFIFWSNYILYTQDERIRDNDLVNFLFQKVNKKWEFYNTYEIHKWYILKDNNFKKIYVNEILWVVIRNIMSLNNFTKSTLLTNKKEYSVNNNKIIEAYIYHKDKGFISNMIEKWQ